MEKHKNFFMEFRDPQKYVRYEDIPDIYKNFFMPTEDGEGFVFHSVATYTDSARHKSDTLRNNPATSFLRAYVDDAYVDADMVQREDAEIAAAITDLRKEGVHEIKEHGAVVDTPDKIRVTFSYRGHDFVLTGYLGGVMEEDGNDMQENTDEVYRKVSSYRFVILSGTFDGKAIAREDFVKCTNDFTAPIVTKLQLMAQEFERKNVQ